ncbi:unnamed protein product [Rotaria sp. Silwood1]|nr:unnamed protein product [Rotaria sp. Silwood1]CAF3441067.1 unnamed protein product [Rotaria sp. Silwood1]CAF4501716.1 unnamed protein product [Rotaria sp. Silwood1]
MTAPAFDRRESAMLGHAYADNFQALTDMALGLSKSLQECRKFDGSDVISHYLSAYHGSNPKPNIGNITNSVYEEFLTHIKEPPFKLPIKDIYSVSYAVHEKNHGLTSGCNPAQRSFPLAFCKQIDDKNLFQIACDEARLTHYSTTAGQISGLTCLICRYLINGYEWDDAITSAFETALSTTPDLLGEIQEIQKRYKDDDILNDTLNEKRKHIYAPNTLHTALYCITKADSFESALVHARRLDPLYCPILVGILAGARWCVPPTMLPDNYREKIKKIKKMSAGFRA